MGDRPRRQISCRLCSRVGHNIRSCTLFNDVKRTGIEKYKPFLFYAIIGHSLSSWDKDMLRNYPTSDMELEDEYIEIFEKHRHRENALEYILSEPLDWLISLDDVSIRAFKHGYKIIPNTDKTYLVELLHYILISEADQEWMFSYDITNCVPYIIESCKHFNTLDQNNATILCFPFLMDRTQVIASLYNVPYREERMKQLYDQNRRLLRLHNNDIHRHNTRIHDVERQIERSERERHSLENRRTNIYSRRDQILAEINLFPSCIFNSKIKIVDKQIDSETKECPICYENLDSDIITNINCGHVFCSSCILSTLLKKYDGADHKIECLCPLCRNKLTHIFGDKPKIKKRLFQLVSLHRFDEDILELFD